MRMRTARDDFAPWTSRSHEADASTAAVEEDEARILDAGGGVPRDELAHAAVALLLRLPGGMLRCTSERFPHVLPRIAHAWAEPDRLQRVLDELMYDERGGRAGFPFEVLAELAELRRCHERWVGPRTRTGR
jgi:hypothetical protein